MSSSIFMADRIDLLCFGLICVDLYVVLARFVVFGSIVVFRIDFCGSVDSAATHLGTYLRTLSLSPAPPRLVTMTVTADSSCHRHVVIRLHRTHCLVLYEQQRCIRGGIHLTRWAWIRRIGSLHNDQERQE